MSCLYDSEMVTESTEWGLSGFSDLTTVSQALFFFFIYYHGFLSLSGWRYERSERWNSEFVCNREERG